MDNYILNENGEPVAEPDILKWAVWFEKAERKVAHTIVGDATVITLFLGLNARFGSPSPPVLWETMVFGGEHDDLTKRYTSKADAEAGHREVVAMIEAAHPGGGTLSSASPNSDSDKLV